MNTPTSFCSSADECDPNSPCLDDALRHSVKPPEVFHSSRQTNPTHALTDAEREAHIKSCGYLMEDAMRRWCETGDFGYRGEADRWKVLMQEAIKGRSAAQVARMEQERGLA